MSRDTTLALDDQSSPQAKELHPHLPTDRVFPRSTRWRASKVAERPESFPVGIQFHSERIDAPFCKKLEFRPQLKTFDFYRPRSQSRDGHFAVVNLTIEYLKKREPFVFFRMVRSTLALSSAFTQETVYAPASIINSPVHRYPGAWKR